MQCLFLFVMAPPLILWHVTICNAISYLTGSLIPFVITPTISIHFMASHTHTPFVMTCPSCILVIYMMIG